MPLHEMLEGLQAFLAAEDHRDAPPAGGYLRSAGSGDHAISA
jgi:hypothetical protein